MINRTNCYQKARRILARVIAGHKVSLPVGSESFKEVLRAEPTVDCLRKAADLMLLVAAWEVTPSIPKLTTLGPVYKKGVWVCQGRLAKGLENLMGKESLPTSARKVVWPSY